MDISDWRQKIDELDEQIVRLISQRAEAAKAIGELKRTADLPVYEPHREQDVFNHVRAANPGPLAFPDRPLQAHGVRLAARASTRERATRPSGSRVGLKIVMSRPVAWSLATAVRRTAVSTCQVSPSGRW